MGSNTLKRLAQQPAEHRPLTDSRAAHVTDVVGFRNIEPRIAQPRHAHTLEDIAVTGSARLRTASRSTQVAVEPHARTRPPAEGPQASIDQTAPHRQAPEACG